MYTATVFDIERNSYVDGPGIRTTVFFKGCNLKCAWCHNPESWSFKPQIMFYKDKCIGCGKCKEKCPNNLEICVLCGECTKHCFADARRLCGREYTVNEVLSEIIKDKSYYDNSGGGVTFSGGECMLQLDFLAEILKICKENNIHTAVDTAGNVPYSHFEKIIPFTDLFLYDIKCFSEDLHIKGTGASNGLILNNLKKLSEEFEGEIIVRIPLIGGFNDDFNEVIKIKEFLQSINIKNIEVLPYHEMGLNKFSALGIDFRKFYLPKDIDQIRLSFLNE